MRGKITSAFNFLPLVYIFFACSVPAAEARAADAEQEALISGTISGYCFNDVNKNGTMDEGEFGIEGIQISLKKVFLFFKKDAVTAATDANGMYVFSDLISGKYLIEASAGDSYESTTETSVRKQIGLLRQSVEVNFGFSTEVTVTPGGEQLSISGNIYFKPGQGQGSVVAAEGAGVLVTTDLNGNGIIENSEKAAATAGDDGSYSVTAPAQTGLTTLVAFEKDGYAKLLRTIKVNTLAEVTGFNGTLSEMDPLSEDDSGLWTTESGAVEISGIEISSGRVKIFNPATDADKFPGSFSDSQGNMLISGVFTAFDLNDSAGNKIRKVSSMAGSESDTARVRMKMPRDTWNVIKDVTPGNGQIDVPMYYFDEATGEWIRGSDGSDPLNGWLEDTSGEIISEAELANIRDKTYSGDVYTASDVTHFSYWNVDWPVETHACIQGRVVDDEGNPVSGATVTVRGVTYSGTSTPQLTDSSGRFCVDVMRSEGPGEDIDNDGVTGETQKVIITVSYQGKLYRYEETAVPETSGSCPSDCLDAGDLSLSQESEVEVSLCEIEGKVLQDGSPAGNAMVWAYDETLDPEVFMELCYDTQDFCSFFAYSDENGEFSVSAPYATILKLSSYRIHEEGDAIFYYLAEKSFTTCPAETVEMDLVLEYCFVYGLPEISYQKGIIAWEPDTKANSLLIMDSTSSNLKWGIYSDEGFSPPVTYGKVPAGATQSFPLAGAPDPIDTGDLIMLYPLGGRIPYNGYECYGFGEYYTVQ